MEVTVLVPADMQRYNDMITGEQDFKRAAELPFVKKKVVVPYSRDVIRATADAAAKEMPDQAGPGVNYLKVEKGTAYVLLNMDRDGWAGVSFYWAASHPVVEKTLLRFRKIKRVVWDEAPGDKVRHNERAGASPPKQRETYMMQIAAYQDSDEATARLVLRSLHEQGILFGGTGGGGWMCICVYPSEAAQARRILRSALLRLSPEQREHSLKVFDQPRNSVGQTVPPSPQAEPQAGRLSIGDTVVVSLDGTPVTVAPFTNQVASDGTGERVRP
jgi:hypothetical protein